MLIKNGRVIDPALDLDGQFDVGIDRDKIAQVAQEIPGGEARQVIDVAGRVVTPGLIDLHCHVYDAVHKISVAPDVAGVRQGVTTVVDGGSSGQAVFGAFPRYVIPAARTSVYVFLNICSTGLCVSPENREWWEVDLDGIASTIEAHRDVIKGIKVRMINTLVGRDGLKLLRIAKEAAGQFGLPVMVHIGDRTGEVGRDFGHEYLPLLERGDILSHVYTAKPAGCFTADGRAFPELVEAMERGVVIDVADGGVNISFGVAARGLEQGIVPTTISSDVAAVSVAGPVYGLTTVMSKMMALGVALDQAIGMATINPARALGIDNRVGSLKPGMNADLSILEVLSGSWLLEDGEQQTMRVNTLLAPHLTVKYGQPIQADIPGPAQVINGA